MKDDKIYLEHILGAIEQIQEYIKGFDYEKFEQDRRTVDAVVRNLEIIGEATNSLSSKFKASFPDYALQDPIDMRNFLIHEYFGVRADVVWGTCQKDLPELKIFVQKILEK